MKNKVNKSFLTAMGASKNFHKRGEVKPIPRKGIAVDGGCSFGSGGSSSSGTSYYRGIDLETGELLFEEKIGEATNNIAEFLAICHALFLFEDELPIYSDSATAISWVNNKMCNTSFHDEEINEIIQNSERYLWSIHYKPEVKKWLTRDWGENPADFGRKNK